MNLMGTMGRLYLKSSECQSSNMKPKGQLYKLKYVQPTLHIHGFHIFRFNQLQIKNIQKKKKIPENLAHVKILQFQKKIPENLAHD